MTALRAIGDIGGTYARFAIAERGKYNELQHLSVSKCATLKDAFGEYLDALPRDLRPTRAALAVAGPVSGDEVKLTNLNWSFSTAKLKAELGMSSLVVVNDFAATAMSVPYLPEVDCYPVGQPQQKTGGPVGIIGPGTGLGVGALVPDSGRWILLPGEGGHSTLPPATHRESLIVEVLRTHWPHVSAERVLSGAGLVNLYQAICSIEGKRPDPLSPADVTDRAMRGNDPTCVKAFEVFCSMLGTVAGNLALTIAATGGIYIAGGILLRFKEAFASSPFRERFEDKGRFKDYLHRIPTHLILDESPALLGLANLPLEP
ncbi:MAG: glucokinase [Pseudomonadota bacterium]